MLTETWFWVKGSQNGCCRTARPLKQGHIITSLAGKFEGTVGGNTRFDILKTLI